MSEDPLDNGASPRRPRVVPLIVACAFFMESLDSTIIATALPAIADALGEDPLHLSLAITAYLLSLAIFIPLSGWMADRYGARAVFRNAILIFLVGSLACAAAQNIGQLVAARMLQGMGGAMMVPVGRLVLLRAVPKAQLLAAMSFLAIPAMAAPILGPPLGGLIATYTSWRWIFLINLPIGVIGYYFVNRYIHDIREQAVPPLDLAGWMMIGGGIAGLMFGFESLGKQVLAPHWPPLAIAAGLLLVLMYVRHQRKDSAPILRLALLRVPTFRIALASGTLFRLGVGAYSLLLPMMLQLAFGMTPLDSGLITFAGAVGALMMKIVALRLARRFGFRRLLSFNSIASALGLVACGFLRPELPYALMLAFLFVIGFLRSLHFTCINAMAYADIDESRMSQATSLSSTVQQLGLSMGVGIGAQILNLSLALRGGATLAHVDFSVAFVAVGLLSMMSVLSVLRLAPDAGTLISGHGAPTAAPRGR